MFIEYECNFGKMQLVKRMSFYRCLPDFSGGVSVDEFVIFNQNYIFISIIKQFTFSYLMPCNDVFKISFCFMISQKGNDFFSTLSPQSFVFDEAHPLQGESSGVIDQRLSTESSGVIDQRLSTESSGVIDQRLSTESSGVIDQRLSTESSGVIDQRLSTETSGVIDHCST